MHWVPEIVHGMNSERTSKKWSSVWMVMTSRNSRLVATCRWNNGWIWAFTSEPNPWWFEKTHRQGTQQWRHHKAWRSTRRSGDGFLTAGCPGQVSKRRDSPSIDVDKKTLAASASFHEWIKYHVSETKVKIVKTCISELDQDCWRCIDSFFYINLCSVVTGYEKTWVRNYWPLL